MSDHHLLQQLKSALKDAEREATFACGGVIPIVLDANRTNEGSLSPRTQGKVDDQLITTKPVTIRFGPSGSGQTFTVPTDTQHDPVFATLLSSTQPAQFGLGGRNVYDEGYRKASQLDPSEFCTDCSAYETGIVDIINQALLPPVVECRAVRAELYKLNVYSGPSGRFKAHVDTPRSDRQVGSLVVCLPSPFEGAVLSVRNQGKTVFFDWSTSNGKGPCVQWAAFYSDCEHEVHEVTSGHRLTLTYNLYISRGTGLLTGQALNMDPTHLPLYKLLKEMLENPIFMPQGGVLGIYLNHSYAHTNKTRLCDLPSALKGVDMVLHETARAANLQFKVVPVMDLGEDDIEAVYWDRFREMHVNHDFDSEYCDRWETVLQDGTPIRKGDVTWINRSQWPELKEAYIAYGNQAEMDASYTSAAILIQVASFGERNGEVRKAVARPMSDVAAFPLI